MNHPERLMAIRDQMLLMGSAPIKGLLHAQDDNEQWRDFPTAIMEQRIEIAGDPVRISVSVAFEGHKARDAFISARIREINPEWRALESSGLPYWESDSTGKIGPFPANKTPCPPNLDGDGWQQRGE